MTASPGRSGGDDPEVTVEVDESGPARRGPHGAAVRPSPAFVPFPIEAVGGSVPARFAAVVRAGPDRVAVKAPGRVVRYGELDRESDRVARAVLASGAGGGPVALLMDKGAGYVASIFGVLKAGSFYLPLAGSAPVARSASIVADSEARLLLTDAANLATARRVAEAAGGAAAVRVVEPGGGGEGGPAPGAAVGADDYAYLLYTSGSTGQPKGIVETHRNLLHNVRNAINDQKYAADDTILCANAFTFSGSLKNLFGALLSGGAVAPFDVETEGLGALAGRIESDGVTVVETVSTVFRHFAALLPEGKTFPGVRLVRLGGEGVSSREAALVRKHFPPGCLLINGYGATETGTVRVFVLDPSGPVPEGPLPVGYPVEGLDVALVDDGGREVADGEVGQIAVRSAYLSPGYWKSPGLTGSVFLPADAEGRRTYLTGDLGRLGPDGLLEHLGRKDAQAQVKVRGSRVEVGDVEAALRRVPGVTEAVVVARADLPEDRRLVGYVVFAKGPGAPEPLPARGLRQALAGQLPAHAVPSAFVVLDALPVSAHGKLDRQALPPPTRTDEYVAPRDDRERRLAEVWEEVVGVRPVGVRDDFFELGGHSLLAANLMARVGRAFGTSLPLELLLTAPTIERMAEALAEAPAAAEPPGLVVALRATGAKPPLFLLAGSGGHVFGYYETVRRLDPDRPVFGLQFPDPAPGPPLPETVEAMAERFLPEVLAIQPEGPYLLGGYSFGGTVAYELAQQLLARGHEVALLALFDTWGKGYPRRLPPARRALDHLRALAREGPSYLRDRASRLSRRRAAAPPPAHAPDRDPAAAIAEAFEGVNQRAWARYQPRPYPGKLVIFRATDRPTWPGRRFDDPTLGWGRLARGGVDVRPVPGDHITLLYLPHALALAESLQAVLG